MSKIGNLLSRTHPEYNKTLPDWLFWEATYLGGKEYIESNLHQYFKEGDEEFKQRRERATRENHSKRIVDKISANIFKEGPLRNSESDRYTEWLKNVDGHGTPINRYMEKLDIWASVFGRVYNVMDKLPLEEGQITGTFRDNLMSDPYMYMVFPQNMLDIAFLEDGSVKWALVKEIYRDDEDPYGSTGDLETRYRLWEIGQYTLYDEHGGMIEQKETGIDCVPIIVHDSEESLSDYTAISLLADIAPIDRSIMNNWSRLDTIVNDQTFSQLIFPIESIAIKELIDNERLREDYFALASNRVLLYSAAAGIDVKPEFISPDASQAEFILSLISRQIKHLYSHIGLGATTGEEVKPESGISKAYDLDALSNLLASKAESLEETEQRVVALFSKWIGEDVEVEINYPDDFDVRTLAEEISMALDLSTLRISETFMKEFEKRIVKKALPKAFSSTVSKIEKEIEEKKYPDPNALDEPVFDFDKGSSTANGKNKVEEKYAKKKGKGTSRTTKKTASAK